MLAAAARASSTSSPTRGTRRRGDGTLQDENLREVIELTREGLRRAEGELDAIVWPETVITSPFDADAGLRALVADFVDEVKLPLVLGVARSPRYGKRGLYRNSALWVEPGRGITDAFDKTRAVPIVEAASPMTASWTVRALFGASSQGPRVEEGRAESDLHGSFSIVPLLCYEAIFPGLASARSRPGSVAILNLANDSWSFHPTASEQQIAFGRFRAVERRMSFVRVAHGGISVAIDPLGRVGDRLPFGSEGSFVAETTSLRTSALEVVALAALLLCGAVVSGLMVRLLLGRYPGCARQ